jgi:hypothetical protein
MARRPYRHTGAYASARLNPIPPTEAIARDRVLSAIDDFAKLREVRDGLTDGDELLQFADRLRVVVEEWQAAAAKASPGSPAL